MTNESATRTRKRLGITVEAAGAAPPPPWNNWSDGDLEERVAAALPRGGWPRPTPVQAQAAPVLLEGRDALVVAPTGGGKTGAFLVPARRTVSPAPASDQRSTSPKTMSIDPRMADTSASMCPRHRKSIAWRWANPGARIFTR